MTVRAAVRSTSVVTRRGLEITIPTPNVIVGCLTPLMLLLGFAAMILFFVSDVLVDGGEGWRRTLDELFGWEWLAVGGGIAVLTFLFSGRSNAHTILGTRAVRYQQRIGRIVLGEQTGRLDRLRDVEAHCDAEGHWVVRWRSRGRPGGWYVLGTLEEDDARALTERIRVWLAAPGTLPVEGSAHVPTPIAAIEAGVSLVSSRLTLVVPLLFGTAGLLLLALGWQLYGAQQGTAPPLPRLDRVADGELVGYRWVVHAPTGTDRIHARVFLQLGIAYTADDGARRTLWLKSRQAPELYRLRDGPLQHATALLGLPALEFHLPAWSGEAFRGGESWAEWLSLEFDPSPDRPLDRAYDAARLLNGLDEPFHYLLALWASAPPDWRVAYSARTPDRAMPLWWAEAEQAALQQVSFAALLPLGALALLLVFSSLPALVPGTGGRRWVGRVAVLGVVAAVPWWADAVDRLPRFLGAHDLVADVVADAVRLGAPEPLTAHAFLVRARPPSPTSGSVVVAWTPARSAAAGLLRELGLDSPPPELPLADSAVATAYMVARAEAALRALDAEGLAAFGARYRAAEWHARADALHVAVVAPAICRLLSDAAYAARVPRPLAQVATCDPDAAPAAAGASGFPDRYVTPAAAAARPHARAAAT